MKSISTRIVRVVRQSLIFLDFLLWIIIDPSKFKRISLNKVKKILIIHPGAIGEILIATPIMKILKSQLNTEIHFMVSPGKEQVLQNNLNVDGIIPLQKKWKENLIRIKKEKFDMAIILWPSSLYFSFMCFLAGIRYRLGGCSSVRGWPGLLFTRRMLDLRNKHAVQANLDIIKPLKLKIIEPKLEFYYSKENLLKVKNLLKKWDVDKYVVIHPGFSYATSTKYPSRFWPAERYAEVADFLIKKHGLKIIITGVDDEKKFAEDIKHKMKFSDKLIISNGLINYGEMGALIDCSKLVLAPGTSTIHLAAAFDKPIIALMGKENPLEWHPWTNKKNYRILFHPEKCTECDKNYCIKKNIECMMATTSKEAIKMCSELLRLS